MFKNLPLRKVVKTTHVLYILRPRLFLAINKQFIFIIKVLSLLVSTNVLGDTSSLPNNLQPQISNADCLDFINERSARIHCGFIELPVDHDEPAKQVVTLPVLIARQTRTLLLEPSNKAILIPGGGGPGGSMGFGYEYQSGTFLKEFASLRAAGFDIVIVDQRGAGFSKPSLRCIETNRAFKQIIVEALPFEEELNLYSEAIDQCTERMRSDNIDLGKFDTYQSAKDFLAIMDAMPYESWNVLATSYATVIAQAIELLRPKIFERMVLDSPVPLDYQHPSTIETAIGAIIRILTLCEKTKRCNKKHPDINDKFTKILSRLRDKPITITTRVFDTSLALQRDIELMVSDTTLLEIFITAAYNNYSLADIPWLVDNLYKNKTRALRKYAEDYWYSATDLDFADGLSWSVHCKERRPLEDNYINSNPGPVEKFSANTLLALRQERQICEKLSLGTDRKLVTDQQFTPETLLLAGDLDPVISRHDIRHTADNFANKQTIILPGMGHSVWYQSECTRATVLSFLTATALSTEATCRDGIRRFK